MPCFAWYNISMLSVLDAFSEPILKALPRIPQAILALAVGVLFVYFLQWIIEKTLKVARTPRTLLDILSSIAHVVLWVILIAAIFQSLGLTQIAFTISGSLAIVGVAIGAGANTMVQDIIAGLFLARDKDFDVGYQIKMGDIEGTIKKIDIRKIRVEDKQGHIHVIPNSMLDRASWIVLRRD